MPSTLYSEKILNFKQQLKKSPLKYATLLFSFLFCLRIVVFSFNYGAIEHDSGWFFGVARSVAENFKYAAYTNPLRDEVQSIGTGIWGRPAIQDHQGMTYFTSGVSAGPAFVFPEAIFLKIFGYGVQSYKIFPLLCFGAMVGLALFFTFQISGYSACLLLLAWWWALPQMHLGMAYEGLAEHIAMFYFLAGLYLFQKNAEVPQLKFLIGAGILIAMSILTKLLFLQFLAGFVLYFAYQSWVNKKIPIKSISFFAISVATPLIVFELYRYLVFSLNFNHEAWQHNNLEHTMHFSSGGGTLDRFLNFDWNHFYNKLHVGYNIGVNSTLFFWLLVAVAMIYFWKKVQKTRQAAIQLIITCTLVMSLWYLLISSAGFARHFYPAIIMIQILLTCYVVELVKNFSPSILNTELGSKKILLAGLLALLFLPLLPQVFSFSPWLSGEHHQDWNANRYIAGLQGFPTNPIFSLDDQLEAVNYVEEHKGDDTIYYYHGWLLVADISGITGTVFYPLDRITYNRIHYPKKNHLLIMGPYSVANHPARVTAADFTDVESRKLCQKSVFRNGSYAICQLK